MSSVYKGKPMQIKSVRDLYLRWSNARLKLGIRPDAVCTNFNPKNRSTYRVLLATYTQAAQIILDNVSLGIETATNDEMLLLNKMVKTNRVTNLYV